MADTTIIVTGASGELGRKTLNALLCVCPTARIIGTYHTARPGPLARVGWMSFDLKETRGLLAGRHSGRLIVFHFACTSSRDYARALKVDVEGTRSLYAELRDSPSRNKMFVYASSVLAYEPFCGYGLAKRFAEEELRLMSSVETPVIVLRICNVQGRGKTAWDLDLDAFPAALIAALPEIELSCGSSLPFVVRSVPGVETLRS